jgi:Predicted transporter component|tara:strand:+ start:188 stop:607 length:420 start_codon:yes stop_codon:yes gene_type:complete
MNIINFTPVSALTGGLLIGLSVALFFILNGRMIGVSGIASNFLISKDKKSENLLFLVGLILGPLIYTFILGGEINILISNSLPLLTVGGILVGFGTKLSSGCTSGHGISGISRFSLRSIIATITFMIVGILTVLIKNIL